MPTQVDGALMHAMSGNELSRVRTEFRLRPPEPINQSLLESREPTLLCNQVQSQYPKFPISAFYKGESQEKKLPGDWKEQRFLPGSPAHVMLGGSWGFFFRRVMLLS